MKLDRKLGPRLNVEVVRGCHRVTAHGGTMKNRHRGKSEDRHQGKERGILALTGRAGGRKSGRERTGGHM